MSFDISGKLYKAFDTETKGNNFNSREFVIKTEGDYPQFIKFQLVQDRCTLIDGIPEGNEMRVFFDLRGREWNDKFFTTLNAWKIEADKGHYDSDQSDKAQPKVKDDMPF